MTRYGRATVEHSDVEHVDNVRALELGGEACLAQEPRGHARKAQHFRRDDLECHSAREKQMRSLEDGSHSAGYANRVNPVTPVDDVTHGAGKIVKVRFGAHDQ